MSQNVQPIGALSSPAAVSPTQPAESLDLPDRRQARSQEDANQLARYRLIIEGGPGTGYVYKSVDRVTGEIVSQFPNDIMEQLGSDPKYAEGKVIDTTA